MKKERIELRTWMKVTWRRNSAERTPTKSCGRQRDSPIIPSSHHRVPSSARSISSDFGPNHCRCGPVASILATNQSEPAEAHEVSLIRLQRAAQSLDFSLLHTQLLSLQCAHYGPPSFTSLTWTDQHPGRSSHLVRTGARVLQLEPSR